MLDNVLRIATRQNPLALWRAHCVEDKLVASRPGLVTELVLMVMHDDMILDTPLAKVGGKGLFAKGLEVALPENCADIAIRSVKDVPVGFPQGLGLVTICGREDPRDAFVSDTYDSLDVLPVGSIIGTSSLRCQRQLIERRSDLIIRSLRGSVDTHLSKLGNDEYNTIILVVTGLKRLGLESHTRATLPPEISLPAAGQSAMGIECRFDNTRTREPLAALNHHETVLRAAVERAMNTHLEDGCQVPTGSCAELTDGEIWLRALVGTPGGSQIICGERRGAPQDAEQVGISLIEELLNNGVREVPAEVYNGDTLV